jgi:NitT/TauT family transport system ATP-binding protein
MNAANKITVNQPGSHLRLVSDRAGSGTPGIKLSGVSKTYRSRGGGLGARGGRGL